MNYMLYGDGNLPITDVSFLGSRFNTWAKYQAENWIEFNLGYWTNSHNEIDGYNCLGVQNMTLLKNF